MYMYIYIYYIYSETTKLGLNLGGFESARVLGFLIMTFFVLELLVWTSLSLLLMVSLSLTYRTHMWIEYYCFWFQDWLVNVWSTKLSILHLPVHMLIQFAYSKTVVCLCLLWVNLRSNLLWQAIDQPGEPNMIIDLRQCVVVSVFETND